MASPHVYDQTKALLQSQFAPVYPILDFDQIETTLTRTGATAFMAIEEITDDEQLAAFGDPQSLCQRQEGVIVVHMFTPAPVATPGGLPSSNVARGLANDVHTFMRHRRYADIRITSVSPPDIELMNNGLWTAAAVAVTYQWNFHVAMPVAIP